ncbi:hypothetical protein [Streptomyces sp. NPDC020983]|uniref:hypothetical protein n=1 Tax=Streptomyces sp. NPDC020983 TaxID=3365106 RepID=UPI0037BAD589
MTPGQTLVWALARHAMVPLNHGAPRSAADLATRACAEAGRKPSAAAALAAAVAARAVLTTRADAAPCGICRPDRPLRAAA